MRLLAGSLREPPAAIIIGAVGLLAAAIVANGNAKQVAPLVAVACVLAAWHRPLFRWHNLIALIVISVFVVPIKAYRLPGSLPFNLELYRLLVAALLACWLTSLLIDPRVRLRRSAFDKPLLILVFVVLVSDVVNPGRVNSWSSFVAKSLMFFLSFVLLYFLIVSVVRTRSAADIILKVLVGGGALVAAFGLYEYRTGYNVFDHVDSVIPFLDYQGARQPQRLGRFRIIGSAQHPIALGATFAVLVPLSISLARTSSRRWRVATLLLLLGALATGSRTAIIMLIVIGMVFLRLKPVETKRLAPLLVPAFVVVHVAVPGAIVTFRNAFFPSGGLIAEQSQIASNADPNQAGGRIRLLRPSLEEWSRTPILGQGWGTRVTGYGDVPRNAPILDDQWLAMLLETGAAGFASFIWLMVGSTRRLTRAARDKGDDPDSWLFAGLAAAIAGFAVGMLTYDTFSFIQVTFLFWVVLGLAAAFLGVAEPTRRLAR